MHIRKSVLKEPTYTSKQKMSLLRNSRLTKKSSLNFMRNSIAIWRKWRMTNGIMPKLEYLNPPKYDQYPKYRDYLRKVTDFSCAYCTISESESPGATFNIDHFRPQKEFPSLEASCENLRYTCPRCNSYKRSRWIQRTAGCIRDCKTCTTHVCKENIPRFIDTLKELPSEHIFLNEDDMLCAYDYFLLGTL